MISSDIPEIRGRGVEVLRGDYSSTEEALKRIAGLDAYYQTHHSGFYGANTEKITSAIAALQEIYSTSVVSGPGGRLEHASIERRAHRFAGMLPLPRRQAP